MVRQLSRRSRYILVAILSLVSVVLVVASWIQRSKPGLSPWHTVTLSAEFKAKDAREGFGWSEYLTLEDSLFRELEEEIVRSDDAHAEPSWNRYAEGGVNNPAGQRLTWRGSGGFVEVGSCRTVGGSSTRRPTPRRAS